MEQNLDDLFGAANSIAALVEEEHGTIGNEHANLSGANLLDLSAMLDASANDEAERVKKKQDTDAAIKVAAHTAKILVPLFNAIGQKSNLHESEKIQELMSLALNKVRSDSTHVINHYGLSVEDAPAWLVSQVSGNLMQSVLKAIDDGNTTAFVGEARDYLLPLISLKDEANGLGMQSYNVFNVDPDLQLANQLAQATSAVLFSYQTHTLYHSEPKQLAMTVNNFLRERVIEHALGDVSSQWELNDKERVYLGSTLLSSAGKLLAQTWLQHAERVKESVTTMTTEQRRDVVSNGYPLDELFDDFNAKFEGVEISTLVALKELANHKQKKNSLENEFERADSSDLSMEM